VPNLYPAMDRQEVVIHSPRHVRSFAELTDEEIAAVSAAWTARAETTTAGHLCPLINEGRAAGASLPHSHSQLVWLPQAPPVVQNERHEGLDELSHTAADENLVVAGAEDLVAFCHPVGRLPYETMIMPGASREPWPDEDSLAVALRLLRDVVAMLRGAEGAVPWNAWLHPGRPWHIELVPRLAVLAGLELGAGVYINTVAPEDAAQALRN
jgi:UDPglucose--hexose-1-phosphate uridylyltransferase